MACIMSSSVSWRAVAGRCYRLMLTAAMIGCVCGTMTSSLMAQTPVGAPEGPQEVTTAEKEDLGSCEGRRQARRT